MNVHDYLPPENFGRPFLNGTDDTLQYICWYDMFLQAYTDPECDRTGVREELLKGADHLASRAYASAGALISAEYGIGVSRAAEEYSLFGFGFFCLIMAAAQEFDAHYREVCDLPGGFADGRGTMSFALAEELYSFLADGGGILEMRRMRNALRYCPLFTFYPPKEGRGSLFYSFAANRQFSAILRGDYLPGKELSLVSDEDKALGREKGTIVHEAELRKLCEVLSTMEERPEETGIGPGIIQISGPAGSGRTKLILHALPEEDPVLFLSFSRFLALPADEGEEILSDILVRCRLLKETLVIREIPEDKNNDLLKLLEICARHLPVIFLETGKNIPPEGIPFPCRYYGLSLPLPRASERRLLWESELGDTKIAEDVSCRELASKYLLYPGVIRDCVRTAKEEAGADGRTVVSGSDITDAVLSETTRKLDELCERISLKYSWDDLIIDPYQRRIMKTLCSRVKYRSLVDEEWGFENKVTYGKGVSMLLYGSPGTGKTMAAQVMAKDIGMALYRVDLSQLVDKYIGETEKNIGRIFDAASDGNVILFFDEADALFSKRTEIQNSNDKYANAEVAYLLQKIEQHSGVTFLATNRFADFDSAFVRRISYSVHLERPDAAMRLKLFEKILPDKTPRTNDLDLKFFADTFELSGSEIKEVLYSAAFIAASEDVPLGNLHLVSAIKYQQEKTGKLLSNTEFGIYGDLLGKQ